MIDNLPEFCEGCKWAQICKKGPKCMDYYEGMKK